MVKNERGHEGSHSSHVYTIQTIEESKTSDITLPNGLSTTSKLFFRGQDGSEKSTSFVQRAGHRANPEANQRNQGCREKPHL